jgi:hypothetical protein
MEPPMQPLDTSDLAISIIVVVMMPVIIWANLRDAGLKSPLNAYLWREHPNLMRVSLLIIGLITLNSAIMLLGHFRLIPAKVVDIALPVVGIPFLLASVVMIWLAVKAVLKLIRDRLASRKQT